MSKSTNIPFVYHQEGRFLVQVPSPDGTKLFIGRFMDRVNAFIALNEALHILYNGKGIERLSRALKRRRQRKMFEVLKDYNTSLETEPSEDKTNDDKEDLKSLLDR